jgi:hypothetical protein
LLERRTVFVEFSLFVAKVFSDLCLSSFALYHFGVACAGFLFSKVERSSHFISGSLQDKQLSFQLLDPRVLFVVSRSSSLLLLLESTEAGFMTLASEG